MEFKTRYEIIRSFSKWVFLYGYVVCNLGTQIMYFVIAYVDCISCSNDCSASSERLWHDTFYRLVFVSALTFVVFPAAWFFCYWRAKKKLSEPN